VEAFFVRAGIALAAGVWLMLTLGLLVAWQTAALNPLPAGWNREKALLFGHFAWLYGVVGLAVGCGSAWRQAFWRHEPRSSRGCSRRGFGSAAAAAALEVRDAVVSMPVLTLYPVALLIVAGPAVFVLSAFDRPAMSAVPGGAAGLVLGMLLLCLLSVVFVRSYDRELSHPERVRRDLAVLMKVSASPGASPQGAVLPEPACHPENRAKVLLFGWDGATWKVIRRMLARGELPHLKRLMDSGSAGTMQAYSPPLSPVIWSSIATGCLPSKHGVRDFTIWRFPGVATPVGELPGAVLALRLLRMLATGWEAPISSDTLRRPTLWQILGNLDRRVGVVGWWGSWPAQEVNGFLVSDRVVFHPSNMNVSDLSSLQGLTFPEPLYARIRGMLRDPDSVTLEEARQFLDVQELRPGFRTPHDPEHLFKIALTMSESYRDIGLKLYKDSRPDLFAVYFQGIDLVSHYMWQYAFPEEFPSVPAEEVRAYGEVIARFYAYQDRVLGEFLDAADANTCSVVLSDHGFATDEMPFVPAHTGRHDLEGVCIVGGCGVKQGVKFTLTPEDVAPTILALMGATVALDMDGRVLSEILDLQCRRFGPVRRPLPESFMTSRHWQNRRPRDHRAPQGWATRCQMTGGKSRLASGALNKCCGMPRFGSHGSGPLAPSAPHLPVRGHAVWLSRCGAERGRRGEYHPLARAGGGEGAHLRRPGTHLVSSAAPAGVPGGGVRGIHSISGRRPGRRRGGLRHAAPSSVLDSPHPPGRPALRALLRDPGRGLLAVHPVFRPAHERPAVRLPDSRLPVSVRTHAARPTAHWFGRRRRGIARAGDALPADSAALAALAPAAAFFGRRPRRFLCNMVILAITGALVVAPWTLRNYAVHGGFVAVSTQGGYALWQHHNELPPDGSVGTNPAIQQHLRRIVPPLLERVHEGKPAEEIFREILSWRGKAYVYLLGEEGRALQAEFRDLSELETDRLLKRKASEAIRADPARFLRKAAKSAIKFWEPYGDPDFGTGARRYNLAYGCVAPVAATGAVSLLRRRRFPWALALFTANFNALVALFYFEERYRLPVEPCLIALAAAGIVALLAMRRSVFVTAVFAVVLVNGVVMLWGDGVMEALRDFVHGL
jgi:hypothetical protein